MKQKPAETRSFARENSNDHFAPRTVYADAEEGHEERLGNRRPPSAFGRDRRKPSYKNNDEKIGRERVDYSTMRAPSPIFVEHLNSLFPELQFPMELARRILTHSSHPAAIYGHNAGLSFMGRRVISAYLYLLLASSPNLKPSDDIEAIVSRTLNTYVLGEHLGSRWGLGRVMRWTPTLKAERVKDADVALLKGAGLYKVQGDAVAAVMGGIFEQFGASTAHRVFHTRVLPHILISSPNAGLPEAFHGDARSACNRFGGMQGPLVVDTTTLPPLPTEPKKAKVATRKSEQVEKTEVESPSLD